MRSVNAQTVGRFELNRITAEDTSDLPCGYCPRRVELPAPVAQQVPPPTVCSSLLDFLTSRFFPPWR